MYLLIIVIKSSLIFKKHCKIVKELFEKSYPSYHQLEKNFCMMASSDFSQHNVLYIALQASLKRSVCEYVAVIQ